MVARATTAARRIPCASLLLLAPALVIFSAPGLADALELDRSAVNAGEWWRLATGHWTHWTLDHLWWDGVVFLALGAIVEYASRLRFLLTVLASAVACSLVVVWFVPELDTYRGLSGIDSALFGMMGVSLVRDAVGSGRWARSALPIALMAAFAAKTAFEAATGTTLFMDSTAAGTVAVPLAHSAGAAAGGLIAAAAGGGNPAAPVCPRLQYGQFRTNEKTEVPLATTTYCSPSSS